jgi:hypothetical protein
MRAALTSLLLVVPLAAQDFSGTYATVNPQGATITLQLAAAGAGRYTGTLAGAGLAFQIDAQPGGAGLVGAVTAPQGRGFMEARLDGDQLTLVLAEAGPDGNPDLTTAQQLVLTRGGAAAGRMDALGAGTPQGQAPRAGPGMAAPGGQPGALDDGTPLGREWSQGLAGRKLTRFDRYSSGSSGGYTSEEELTLCSNGEYLYRKSSSMSVDVGGAYGSSAGRGGETGRWRVVTQGQVAGLELRATSGEVTLARLDFANNMVHVDGGQVYRTAAEACQ